MDSKKALLPALLAVSSGIAATEATALELGEINVQSALGQPLRASVAYALRPDEVLADYCVSVQPAPAAMGLPPINSARVNVVDGLIQLTTRSVIAEPMSSLRVSVNCPYTPRLARDFVVFLDPSATVEAAAPAAVASRPAPATAATTPRATTTRRPDTIRRSTTAASGTPVNADERYRVQPGDTLSEIAQRIENRSVNLWTSVNEIFAANPNAFIDNDPNMLKAGTWITIPASARGTGVDTVAATTAAPATDSADASPSAAATPDAVAAASDAGTAASETYDLVVDAGAADSASTVDDTGALEPVQTSPAAEEAASALLPDDAETDAAGETVESLQIGDVVFDATPSAEPEPAADSRAADGTATGSSSWGWWFGGGALLLLGGLALFGRRRSTTPPPVETEAAVSKAPRYLDESPTVEVVETSIPSGDVKRQDYDLEDDSPTHENLVIDADLEHGAGLGDAVDVAEDLSFDSAPEAELDLELPADASRADEDAPAPDHNFDDITVEQPIAPEVQAATDDDEYDMSVLIDATQLQEEGEITERDLQAIIVDTIDEEPDAESYTVSEEVDFAIIEQDYEDELTATQAMNKEIERAAAELAESMGDDDAGDEDTKATAQMATVTPIDATAQLSRGNDADEDTASITEDETAEMPLAEDDATAEMPVKTGKGRS